MNHRNTEKGQYEPERKNNMDTLEKIRDEISGSIEIKQKILGDEKLLQMIADAAGCIIESLKSGGKVLLCGNGGSASDALHMAGELLGRFRRERKAYAAVALNADIATMTAIANDYGYEQVFARQVEALMRAEDVLIGFSTSGNSENVYLAFEQAKKKDGKTILLSGRDGGRIKELADICIIVPSDTTSHIQEAHESIYHVLCDIVEAAI